VSEISASPLLYLRAEIQAFLVSESAKLLSQDTENQLRAATNNLQYDADKVKNE
jgi:hypothetical protein